jgi:hypothetical protein
MYEIGKPLGRCGYCHQWVYAQPYYHVVATVIGLVRLCDACAGREHYAYAVSLEQWLQGTVVPERWRASKKQARGKKHGT